MFPCLLLTSALALGDCSGAACSARRAPGYTWHRFASDPGRSYLYGDGVMLAAYDHARNIYCTYDAASDTWSDPTRPPWDEGKPEPIAAPDEKKTEALPNYGVDLERLSGAREERYRLNGLPVSRDRARHALIGGNVPDDAGRLRLTVIGDTSSAAAVTRDLASAPTLAPWKDRLVVQSYPPSHWAVTKAGFHTTGKPTVYVQAPSGKVLHRQDDYADGAEGLAQALRRADPNYDPTKDPDLRWAARFDLSRIPLPAWILVGGIVIVLLLRRRA
jgi:hypothetical protein